MARWKDLAPLKEQDLVTAYEVSVNPAKNSRKMVPLPAGIPIGDLDDYVLAQLHPDHFTAAPEGD